MVRRRRLGERTPVMVLFDLLRRLYGPVVVEAVIDVPQRRVFEVLADPRTYPDWLVGAEDVRQVDCRFPERGAEFHHTVGVSPATIDDSTESLGTSGIDHVALLVHAGPFHAASGVRLGSRLERRDTRALHGAASRPAVDPRTAAEALALRTEPGVDATSRRTGGRVTDTVDAVVIGAGHNGLVAANRLADAGWDVVVLEAGPEPGGAVRDARAHGPRLPHRRLQRLLPDDCGVAGHRSAATSTTRAALESRAERPRPPPNRTSGRGPAPRFDSHRQGSRARGQRRRRRVARSPGAVGSLSEPRCCGRCSHRCPPVRAAVGLVAAARLQLLDLARMAVLPVRRLAAERFRGDAPGLLLAGNALHADVTPEAAPSALLGWMLVGLAQSVGFPVPVGGAGEISRALVRRFECRGGVVRCRTPVSRIDVDGDRATGVEAGGATIMARRAVVAACDAQVLYDRLLGSDRLPPAFAAGLRRFERASSTVKVNWAVDGLVPWADPTVAGTGTVHIAESLDELTMTAAHLATGQVPSHPFLLVGQMTTSDPTRSPAGTESLWAYTHVPQDIRGDASGELDGSGRLGGGDLERFVSRMEDRIEAHAPGFRDRVLARHVQGPADLEAANPSLIGGDISGGTSQLHQQLVFRPVPGWARPETPIAGLYLGSSSAHPGGSVHGACGDNAARAALWHDRARRARAAVRRRR